MSPRALLFAVLAAAGGLVIGNLVLPSLTVPPHVAANEPAATEATRVIPESQAQLQLSFAPVVRSATPSVVNVYATTITQESTSPFANDPFFQRFFGTDGFKTRPRQSQSLGSGVIVEASGVILTNSHVVNGATDIRVATSDGREYPVDLALDDPKTDLAVLRIRDAKGASFPALSFADSDGLQVGDIVLAIGNPFGVGQTVTSGIVSALARTGVESSNYEFFIQTDAAINPGNSGGALVDLQGRLVGINTAIFSRSGGSVGIGFAIPANMARVVAEAGISGGTLVRPWFGARLQEVTSDIASSLGLDRVRGVIVTEVAKDGPADRAGFKAGDVLLAVDGFEINQPSAFDFRLATRKLGSEVELAYIRNGAATSSRFTLEGAPVSAPDAIARVDGNTRFAGIAVESVNPAIAQELGLPFNTRGVVVRSVEQGSPAQRMGLEVGDIILNLNGRDMTDAKTFQSIAQNRPDGWQIVLQRGGRTFSSFVSG
jgi:Do/DeqQ family serine protease